MTVWPNNPIGTVILLYSCDETEAVSDIFFCMVMFSRVSLIKMVLIKRLLIGWRRIWMRVFFLLNYEVKTNVKKICMHKRMVHNKINHIWIYVSCQLHIINFIQPQKQFQLCSGFQGINSPIMPQWLSRRRLSESSTISCDTKPLIVCIWRNSHMCRSVDRRHQRIGRVIYNRHARSLTIRRMFYTGLYFILKPIYILLTISQGRLAAGRRQSVSPEREALLLIRPVIGKRD